MNSNQITCEKCNERFPRKDRLEHKSKCSPYTEHICKACGVSCTNLSFYDVHRHICHKLNTSKSVKCSRCNKNYTSLEEHCMKDCTNPKKCTYCNERYIIKSKHDDICSLRMSK